MHLAVPLAGGLGKVTTPKIPRSEGNDHQRGVAMRSPGHALYQRRHINKGPAGQLPIPAPSSEGDFPAAVEISVIQTRTPDGLLSEQVNAF